LAAAASLAFASLAAAASEALLSLAAAASLAFASLAAAASEALLSLEAAASLAFASLAAAASEALLSLAAAASLALLSVAAAFSAAAFSEASFCAAALAAFSAFLAAYHGSKYRYYIKRQGTSNHVVVVFDRRGDGCRLVDAKERLERGELFNIRRARTEQQPVLPLGDAYSSRSATSNQSINNAKHNARPSREMQQQQRTAALSAALVSGAAFLAGEAASPSKS
jgi:hypothetical protein